ncbi:MAG: response regulator, partial [Ignavibacteriae bacterium]|nr:response regulator [Ignavibacteriota bacterium]
EQAQVVASTAVIVTMTTIIGAIVGTGQTPRWTDFISIVAVGTIGFASVYFSLQYSRQLDEQRRQLLAISTIAEGVNRFFDLDYVLRTALDKTTEFLSTDYGWIYMLDGESLALKRSKGTTKDFLALRRIAALPPSSWLHQPRVEREKLRDFTGFIDQELKDLGIQFWASIPLRSKDTVAGALVVAGRQYNMFTSKQAELMEAFGNQISVALHNAQLFDRLRQSEQQYIDLFENAPDIYISIDHTNTVTGCNTTGARMLGHDKEEILGRKFETLFVEASQPGVRALLARMFNDAMGIKNFEDQMVRKNGEKMDVNVNSTLVFDESGTPVHARIVARDITERKRVESSILHVQKLESIGTLAGGIAHDFNNILAAILGSASIMRRRLPEKGGLSKYVEILEGAAKRGSALTRQLLTFARKTETNIKSVDIHTLIDETLHLFERSVSREIVVQKNFCPEVLVTNGDEGQIQQAMLNLFVNARDAMPNGGTLTITTRLTVADAHTTSQFSSVKPGPFVLIIVSDTGLGMDKAMQNRVFEPWFTTKDFGTGLGLSVVYGVVQNHGGFINLESEVGTGTSFSLYFPSAARKMRSASKQKRLHFPRGTENILLIDDEVSVCEIAKDILSNLGYSVMTAHDGKSGVETYRTRQASIDLVLMNMNMPLLGGRETFRQLKRINPSLPIIIVTGHGKGVVDREEFSSEISGFLQKPFQLEDLATKVRQVLDQRSSAIQLTS